MIGFPFWFRQTRCLWGLPKSSIGLSSQNAHMQTQLMEITLKKFMYLLFLFLQIPFLMGQTYDDLCRSGPIGFQPFYVDYLGESAGASHTLGYFFLDIDTNDNGLPDFAEVGDYDDLDGDGLVNAEDADDDGDGIPDYLDSAGYGGAPLLSESMPASAFRFGEEAAAAGFFPGDYWQFVPNNKDADPGSEYQGYYAHPGVYLYVDANGDEIPDMMQTRSAVNDVPAFAVDKGYDARGLDGTWSPGLLGRWTPAQHLVGETIFYVADDDFGAGLTANYTNYNPYGTMYTDIISGIDNQPDYLIYGTTDEADAAIPAELKVDDARGERLWRYRWLGEPVSMCREVVYFLTVYWNTGGSSVNTYYSTTEFNPDPAPLSHPTNTSGDHFGVTDPGEALGVLTPDNWFPMPGDINDHDEVARCAFGNIIEWADIATQPVDGSPAVAHHPFDQPWVDMYANFEPSRRILNYFSHSAISQGMPFFEEVMAGRYGVDLALQDGNTVFRAVNGLNQHAYVRPVFGSQEVTHLLMFEDLYSGGDRDYDDVGFVISRPPSYLIDAFEPPVNQAPTAAFSFAVNDFSVNFTDESTDSDGAIVDWFWEFGDGSVSEEQNPVHVYEPGAYTVRLTVFDEIDDVAEVEETILIINQPPVAAFSFTVNDFTASFTDESTDADGVIAAWHWDFGDGSSSTEANPSHFFTPGLYNVSLTVLDDKGDAAQVGQQVVVNNQDPLAAFAYTVNELQVGFSDSSSDPEGGPLSWSWDFGDGATSSEQNPVYTFASGGTYVVTLMVTDSWGASASVAQEITVVAPWTELSNDNFESGWGSYIDGGSDCRRSVKDANQAHQGSYCARIRDNSNTSFFTMGNPIDLSSYSELRVDFWYKAASMEPGEDFVVELWDGLIWEVIGNYVSGSDFNNDVFYNPTIVIGDVDFSLTSTSKLRFRCDASGNGDKVYIDEIVVSAR